MSVNTQARCTWHEKRTYIEERRRGGEQSRAEQSRGEERRGEERRGEERRKEETGEEIMRGGCALLATSRLCFIRAVLPRWSTSAHDGYLELSRFFQRTRGRVQPRKRRPISPCEKVPEVSAFVCVREREREREDLFYYFFFLFIIFLSYIY